ncbi:MAG: CoB--CoM heterodisulfide reductase iron-sulfur subunit A family protein [Anaerolineae bacterium]|jgi:heterodisulfide reductase subunit A
MFRSLKDTEREHKNESPRVGVFVCHCGHNIAGYLDVPALVESARALPHVVFATDSLFTCSDAGLSEIRTVITEHELNRVVVASCTPRTHEPLFQATCEEGGLNRYLFEFVNIRDQCSWVHMNEGERATQKAHDLIRMGVAKAALLEPLEESELPVQPAAAIIGGGMAGMTAALSLARRGFAVTLIEREPELGGMLRHLDTLYPIMVNARELVERKVAEVSDHPHIEVLTSAEVNEVQGYIGSYELVVHTKQFGVDADIPVQAGVIIVATGAEELKPVGMYGYGDDPRVVTQQELEGMLVDWAGAAQSPSSQSTRLPTTVVMIQCVGARDETRSYCGRTCCLTAIKNAMLIKERDPSAEVYVLYRDIEVHGTHFEDYYAQARDQGVIFTRYTPENPPQVSEGRVIVRDELLGARLGIPYDLLVLSTPPVPRPGARELAQMLKVPVDEYGFFLEAHVKLRPLDFATDGVYLCGSAHWPAHLDETISQALGAAARAATILSKEQIRSSGVVARVDEYLCRGCERCAEVCEFGAIEFVELEGGGGLYSKPGQPTNRTVARVNPVLCKGCGACAVVCPTCAMQASHFTSEQVAAVVQAALQE